jgi:hypothetical protein
VAHHHIHEGLAQGFARAQAGMPAAEDDGKLRPQLAHHEAGTNRVMNHGAGEQRDTETGCVFQLLADQLQVVAMQCAIDNARFITGFAQRPGETEQTERRPQQLSGVRRQE